MEPRSTPGAQFSHNQRHLCCCLRCILQCQCQSHVRSGDWSGCSIGQQKGGLSLSGVRCYSLPVGPLPSVPIGSNSSHEVVLVACLCAPLAVWQSIFDVSVTPKVGCQCDVCVCAVHVAPNSGASRSVSIRPVLKHGPRSLPCTRVARSCTGPGGAMKVKLRGCNRSQ